MTFFESLAKSCQKRSILHTTNVYDVTNIITLNVISMKMQKTQFAPGTSISMNISWLVTYYEIQILF
jgi:hypothetical protein